MIEIIGVKFRSGGKVYSFDPGPFNPAEGSYVVVETARGPECGEVAARRHAVPESSITAPLKPILRLANDEDLAALERSRAFMREAMRFCEQRVAERGLDMRMVDVECGFDSNRLIFYFTAESRVDFRELVKDLAQQFHSRIELRQIGDRDETKLLGGIGICGREYCCKGYLNNFQPISIKMAKEQGLALNPTKISGACGRLMCCLRYESPVYEELIKLTPKAGSTVLLPGDPPVRAYVLEVNLITGKLRVKPENSDTPVTVSRDEVERLTDTSRRMTRDDLRSPEKSQSAKPAKPEKERAEKPEKPEKKRPEKAKEQRPAQENAPARQKPAKQHPQKQEKQPRTAPEKQPHTVPEQPASAQKAHQPALHPEFGEKQQHAAPAPAPVRRVPAAAALPDDLVEHRAITEQGAERTGAAQPGQGSERRRRFVDRQRRRPNHAQNKPAEHPGGTGSGQSSAE